MVDFPVNADVIGLLVTSLCSALTGALVTHHYIRQLKRGSVVNCWQVLGVGVLGVLLISVAAILTIDPEAIGSWLYLLLTASVAALLVAAAFGGMRVLRRGKSGTRIS